MIATKTTRDTGEAVTTAAAMDEKIAECMTMLAGNTDEHKFAGLLMVTKLGDLPADKLQRVRRQVLTIVGMSFFVRLLHTRNPEDVQMLSSYQRLGLNLIASFCMDSSLAELFAQENTVRFLLKQLALQSTAHESFVDCARILSCMVQTKNGSKVMMREKVLDGMFRVLENLGRLHSNQDLIENIKPAAQDKSMASLSATSWGILNGLASIKEFWTHIHSDHFEFICLKFAHVQIEIAIQVLTVLNYYMTSVELGEAPVALLSSQCLSGIRAGALRLMRAKLPNQVRDQCLRLIFQLMKQSGFSWMAPSTTLRRRVLHEEMSGEKFILLLLRLVAIEIKIMLDEVELSLIQVDETKNESMEEMERRKKEVQRVLAILPICYGILELIISGLVSSNKGKLTLPYDILFEIKGTFSQIFMVVFELLTLAQDYVQTHRYQELRKAHADSISHLDAVICASLRIVSAWIAEDSDTHAELVMQLLPFLVCYKSSLAWTMNDDSENCKLKSIQSCNSDEEIDSDDDVDVDAVSRIRLKAAMIYKTDSSIDQLHFLLPGLLQLSALSDGASIMSKNVKVLQRLMQFCCTICADFADGKNEFAAVSTLTLCLGILINLILICGGNDSAAQSHKSGMPNALEWFHALTFLVPVACACGSQLIADKNIDDKSRREDDRYEMLLHIVCLVLLIVRHFQHKERHPYRLPVVVANLDTSFSSIVAWIVDHPPSATTESIADLYELMRVLSIQFVLTLQVLAR
ncbi:putative neurochondrin [Plasmopara halstedii]